MQKIGTVAFVQVQRYSMKKGEGEARHYDITPLRRVEKLCLTGNGIMGITDDQSVLVDIHNVVHPASRFRGDNRISLGFLPNYDTIRKQFGDHLSDGIAGENIIIEGDLPDDSLGKEWILKTKDGEEIALNAVIPIPPCREFSIFCKQQVIDGAELKQTLQFLSDGLRGYYAELKKSDMCCYIQAGDSLYVR